MKSLIGNKVVEKDIRAWLSRNGYSGKSAKFTEIELHAIQRPGWLQIVCFAFSCLTAEHRVVQLFGGMHSDERYGPSRVLGPGDVRFIEHISMVTRHPTDLDRRARVSLPTPVGGGFIGRG